MKKLFYFLFLIPLFSLSQETNDKIIYLDSLNIETTQGNHKSYRIVEDYNLTKNKYKISEYYVSGKLKKSGFSSKKDNFNEEGEIYNYFESGSIKSIINYKDGYENGNCIYWYENSSKKLEGNYTSKRDNDNVEVLLKVDNFWNKENIQTVINGEGEMTDSGESEVYDADYISKGKIINGFKEGEWKGNAIKPFLLSFTETYNKGKLISGTSIDAENKEYNYTEIQIRPEVKGGIINFYKYVQKNFVQAEDLKKGGTILTRFVVNKDGDIVDLVTIKSVRNDVDAEAIRILSKYNGFSPAFYRGKKVKCSYTIPITVQILR
jgi:antitoxin component YwqK of YwqJK toxin-antitoxin module